MAIRFTGGQQGGNYETYEPGAYDLRVESAEQGVSKSSGKPQLAVKCVFVGGKYDGKTLMTWYSLSEASMWKIAALVEACGAAHTVVGQDVKGNPIIEFEEADLLGCIFSADVTIEEYNSKKNNRINKERASDLVESEPEPAPAPAPAVTKPVATAQTMARRPRTVQS